MDLWTIASEEVEEEEHLARLAAVETAIAPIWDFLAVAVEHEDCLTSYANRRALVEDRIDAAVSSVADGATFAVLRAEVTSNLDANFNTLVRESALARDREREVRARIVAEANARARVAAETERRKSNECPQCGAQTHPVQSADGNKLSASCDACGWSGTKTKTALQAEAMAITCNSCGHRYSRSNPYGSPSKLNCPKCKSSDLKQGSLVTAGDVPPQFQKKDEGTEAPKDDAKPTEGEEKPAGEDPSEGLQVGDDGAPPPPIVQEKIEEANSVQEVPVDPAADPNAQPPADPQGGEKPVEKPGEEKKPDFLKKQQRFVTAAGDPNVPCPEVKDGKQCVYGKGHSSEFPHRYETPVSKTAGEMPDFLKKDDKAEDKPKDDEKGLPEEQGQNDPGNRIDTLHSIMENQQADHLDGMLVDTLTANLLASIYDGLTPENQAKFETIDLKHLVDWAWARTGGLKHVEANPYTNQNPYSDPSTNEDIGRRRDTQGMPDELLDGPNDINLMKDVAPQTTRPRQRPGGQPSEYNPAAPQGSGTSVASIDIICHACKQVGPLPLTALATANLRCVCGSDDLDVFEAISGDLPFGQIDPETPKSVQQDIRCSNCLGEFTVSLDNPAAPLPACPNCKSEAVSAAGATGVTAAKLSPEFIEQVQERHRQNHNKEIEREEDEERKRREKESSKTSSSDSAFSAGQAAGESSGTTSYDQVPSEFASDPVLRQAWLEGYGIGSSHAPSGQVLPVQNLAAYNPLSDPESWYNKPDKGPRSRGDLTSEQEARLRYCPQCGAFEWTMRPSDVQKCYTCGHEFLLNQALDKKPASKTAADDFGQSGGFGSWIRTMWHAMTAGGGEIPSWFPKNLLTPEEMQSGRFHGMDNIGSFASLTERGEQVVKKVAEIASGVRGTNPGMTIEGAIEVAAETVIRYPKVAGFK